MTCHLAMLGATGAVMFSDSQGSDSESENHGNQKQFVGEDFLVGGAGHGWIVMRLLAELSDAQAKGNVDAARVEKFITDFMLNEVAAEARGSVDILVTTLGGVKRYTPGVFTKFGKPMAVGSIGSGATYIGRAQRRVHAARDSVALSARARRCVALRALRVRRCSTAVRALLAHASERRARSATSAIRARRAPTV